jgi:hypothetical protein
MRPLGRIARRAAPPERRWQGRAAAKATGTDGDDDGSPLRCRRAAARGYLLGRTDAKFTMRVYQ